MFCRNCGKAISEKDRFCPHCGTRNADFAPDKAPSDFDRDQGRQIDLTDAEFYTAPDADDKDQSENKTAAPKKRRRPFKKQRQNNAAPNPYDDEKAEKAEKPHPENKANPKNQEKQENAEETPKKPRNTKRNLKITALIVVLVLLAGGLGALAFYALNQRYEAAMTNGNNYLDAKKYDLAYASYSKAVNIFKHRADAYEGRAAVRLAQKNYKAAEKQLKQAKSVQDTTYGKALWADLYAHTNRESAAEAQIKQVSIAKDINRRAGVTSGKVCRRLGEPDTGIHIVRRALKRAKTTRDKKALYNELIRLYVAADKSNDDISDLIDQATKDTGDTSYLDKRDDLLIGRPAFSTPSGTYNAGFKLKMKLGRRGEIIHYTTDGSTPTEKSTQYSAPIALKPESTTTVKMIEVNTNGRKSNVVKGIFTIRAVAAPEIGKWKTGNDGLMDTLSFTWKKVNGVTGYEPNITTVTPDNQSNRDIEDRDEKSTTATTVANDSGYKLVGRVRAYVTIDGTKYYSAWSKEITYDNGYDDSQGQDNQSATAAQ